MHEEGTTLPKDHEIEEVEDEADEVTPTGDEEATKVHFFSFFRNFQTLVFCTLIVGYNT